MLDRKPELFRQKSIKRKPEPSKLANQQLNRLWRTIGRMLVCWKEGLLVDTSWFSRGDVMCDAHQKLPSEAHLEHSALEVGDYCSLPPGDDESRALGLCISFKKTRRLFGVVIAAVWDKSFLPRLSMWARDIQGAQNHSTCSVQFCFFLFRLMFVISCSCSSAPRFPLLRNKCTNVLFFSYVLFCLLGGVKGSTGMRVVYLVQSDVSHVQYI